MVNLFFSRIYTEPSENVVGTGDVEGDRAVIAGLDTGKTYTINVAALSDQREGNFISFLQKKNTKKYVSSIFVTSFKILLFLL